MWGMHTGHTQARAHSTQHTRGTRRHTHTGHAGRRGTHGDTRRHAHGAHAHVHTWVHTTQDGLLSLRLDVNREGTSLPSRQKLRSLGCLKHPAPTREPAKGMRADLCVCVCVCICVKCGHSLTNVFEMKILEWTDKSTSQQPASVLLYTIKSTIAIWCYSL